MLMSNMLQVILIVAQRGTSNLGGEVVVGEGSLLKMFLGITGRPTDRQHLNTFSMTRYL